MPKRSSNKQSRRRSDDRDKMQACAVVRPHDPGLKSCMKVATVEESLRKADENDEKRRRREATMAGRGKSRFSLLKKGLSLRGGGLAGNKRGGTSKRGLSILRSSKNDGALAGLRRSGGGGGGRRGSLSRGLSRVGAFLSRRHLGRGSAKAPIDEEEEEGTVAPTEHARETKVSFDTLRFRWYELKAVDNPGVSKGFAIGAGGWAYEEDESPTPVDVHEEYRSTTAPRRKLDEIKISEEERYRRLLDSGVTQSELSRVRKQINLAKGRRRKTLEGFANMKNEERREGAIRKLKKMLGMKKGYDKEVKDLWDAAQKRSSGSGHSHVVVAQ